MFIFLLIICSCYIYAAICDGWVVYTRERKVSII